MNASITRIIGDLLNHQSIITVGFLLQKTKLK